MDWASCGRWAWWWSSAGEIGKACSTSASDDGRAPRALESVESVRQRAKGVVERVESALTGGGRWLVVLVAHGDVLQILQTAFAAVDVTTHRSLPHLETATLRKLHVADPDDWRQSPSRMDRVDTRWVSAAQWPPTDLKLVDLMYHAS